MRHVRLFPGREPRALAAASALLTALLSRMPFAGADALVAYGGLDPRAHDSGRSRGRRRLSKRGAPALRYQMYMAAMSASKTKTFAPTYQALRARGLQATEALVILARKLLRIAFAILRSEKPFEAHRFSPGTGQIPWNPLPGRRVRPSREAPRALRGCFIPFKCNLMQRMLVAGGRRAGETRRAR
ncbi:transposase [Variovorax humicola]|uniref:transposase n=1 Tax=Variovorax humicola TaxID=1769758 RepID=UPI003BF4C9CF